VVSVDEAKGHVPELVSPHHKHHTVHGRHGIGRLNAKIARAITVAVGSMWCAYLFAGIALFSLPAAIRTGETLIIVGWLAQTFLQLVLLPILLVGSRVLAAGQERQAEADHKTLTALHKLNVTQLEILEEMRRWK
jgi:hypothetical protein